MSGCSREETPQPLPRAIVTTDGEVDDYDSFIRLLLYSNEMDLRALVYSSSKFHWAGDGKGTLLLHDPAFPAPDYLRSIVKIGNVMVEGDMPEPTEGSEFIKDIILEVTDDGTPELTGFQRIIVTVA